MRIIKRKVTGTEKNISYTEYQFSSQHNFNGSDNNKNVSYFEPIMEGYDASAFKKMIDSSGVKYDKNSFISFDILFDNGYRTVKIFNDGKNNITVPEFDDDLFSDAKSIRGKVNTSNIYACYLRVTTLPTKTKK